MTSPPTQLRARSSSSGSDSALSSVSNFFELLHPYDISTDSQSSGLLSYLNADASRMKECREFATELHQSAKKANLVDSALLAKADEISKFKLPDFRIVFVGDMGVGKSSAGNSWLNIEHALRTGQSGRSVTKARTEYHQRKAEHENPITATIEFLSYDALKTDIKNPMRPSGKVV